MKREEQESKVTLYNFFYDIKENNVFGQEDEAKYYKGSFFIHDEDGETIYVHEDKLDVPQLYTSEKESFIYVYSLTGDVNRALELINDSFKETVESLKKKATELELTWGRFEAKKMEVAQKYPTGKKI